MRLTQGYGEPAPQHSCIQCRHFYDFTKYNSRFSSRALRRSDTLGVGGPVANEAPLAGGGTGNEMGPVSLPLLICLHVQDEAAAYVAVTGFDY